MSTYRIRKDKNNPYVMMNKEFLSNENLSFKAKGILSYLLSKPDDWKIYEDDLVNQSKDGKTAVRSGLQELMKQGYIIRTQKRTKDGKFDGYDYDVFEHPNLEDSQNDKELTEAGFPKTGNPKTENNKVLINDLTNNELTNIKTEEEEQLSTNTLSTTIKNKYQLIFNRQLSAEFEKEILSIFDDENIINYCLSLAEKKADKPSWLISVLTDWKNEGLNTIEEIKEYQLQRKEENKKKYKRYNTDTEIEVDSNSIKQVKLALKHKTGLDFTDRHIKEVLITDTRNGQKLQDFSTVINAIGKLSNRELSNAVTKDKIIQAISIKVKEISFADRSYNKGYR